MKTILFKSMIPLLGICFLTLLSCRKDREVGNYIGEYELSGYVRDKITQKPIPYALVGVVVHAKGQFYNYGGQEPATGRTDANGRFTLKFFVDQENYRYELMAEALQYFDMGGSGDQITFTKNGKKNQDIRLLPHGYLSCFIKGNLGGGNISINSFHGTYYRGVDTVKTTSVLPNAPLSITYWVESSDTAMTYKRTVQLPTPMPHDTTYYTIEF